MVVLKSDPALEYSEYSISESNDSTTDVSSNISNSSLSSNSSQSDSASSYSVYKYDEVPENKSWASTLPTQKGLYNPEYEKDNCGVGMLLNSLIIFFFFTILISQILTI